MLTNHKIFIVSSPSGGGKTTIVEEVVRLVPTLRRTKSLTTRAPLPRDKNEYAYTNPEDFMSKVEKDYFAEWEEVYPGRLYGTPRKELFISKSSILQIDVNGARKIKSEYPDQVHTIFILPVSPESLVDRLGDRKRGESEEEINLRLARAKMEVGAAKDFDHWVTNDELRGCVARVGSIILTHTLNKRGSTNFCRDIDELNRAREAFGLPRMPVLV